MDAMAELIAKIRETLERARDSFKRYSDYKSAVDHDEMVAGLDYLDELERLINERVST